MITIAEPTVGTTPVVNASKINFIPDGKPGPVEGVEGQIKIDGTIEVSVKVGGRWWHFAAPSPVTAEEAAEPRFRGVRVIKGNCVWEK